MKNKLKFIIPIVIAVIAIIIAALCINFTPQERADVSSLMSTAQKYLIENQYEQAIAEFNKVIELEPMNVDAYIGLAEASVGMGDTDKAIEVLEKGYEITGDERLEEMIDRLTGGNAEAAETAVAVTTVTTTEPQVEEFITIKDEQYSTLLTWIDLSSKELTDKDIKPLEKMVNLTILYLGNNQISDISALSELTNLTSLDLNDNQISDISALSELTNLKKLELDSNQISNISVLSGLTNLISLGLFNNQISDISALNELTNLETLSLGDNRNISKSDIEALKQALPDCYIH